MNQNEVMTRVVGILTQAREWVRPLEEGADRKDISITGSLVEEMLNEVLAYRFSLPSTASHQEIAEALNERMTVVAHQLAGAFIVAFLELAHVHDTGQTAVSSAEVLRKLALNNQGPAGDDA